MSNRYDWPAYADIRRILALVHELHCLPPGGDGRRRRMLEGLCALVGADAAESAVVRRPGGPTPPPGDRVLSSIRVGGERWAPPPRALIAGNAGRREALDPVLDRLLAALGRRREANATVTRTQRARVGAGGGRYDAVYSARALGPNVALLCLARRDGRPFDRRENRTVQLVHSEVGWVYETTPPPPGELTPRQRECLQCLLAGKSEKRIASDLRLSQHTVHVHVKAIYRQLGVSTRAELLARFIDAQTHRARRPTEVPVSLAG